MATKTKKRKCVTTALYKLSDNDKKVVAEILNDANELARNITERCNKLINESKNYGKIKR